MGKVKITQEQADEIEYLLEDGGNKKAIVLIKVYDWFHKSIIINSIELDTLIRALYIGYEIEETFEVGDWIVVEDCPCKRIIGKVQKITEVEEHSTFTRLHYDRDWWSVISESKIRHATPEEIAEEKQRRFWHENGREVGKMPP